MLWLSVDCDSWVSRPRRSARIITGKRKTQGPANASGEGEILNALTPGHSKLLGEKLDSPKTEKSERKA